MLQKHVIFQFQDEIDALTPTDWAVRTDGGNQDDDFPSVIISDDSERVSTGHTPFSSHKFDSSGNKIGKKGPLVYDLEVDLEVKTYSEKTSYDIANDLKHHFIIYEDDSDFFHEDTSLWDVGDIKSRSIQQFSPDWYTKGLKISLRFEEQVVSESNYDTLETVNETINTE